MIQKENNTNFPLTKYICSCGMKFNTWKTSQKHRRQGHNTKLQTKKKFHSNKIIFSFIMKCHKCNKELGKMYSLTVLTPIYYRFFCKKHIEKSI